MKPIMTIIAASLLPAVSATAEEAFKHTTEIPEGITTPDKVETDGTCSTGL